MTAPMRRSERDGGQVTAFVVVWVMALMLVMGLVLDGGLALAGKIRAINEAQEAARAGAQQLDLVTYRATGDVVLNAEAATSAARAYLADTGNPAAGTATVTVAGDRVTVRVNRSQPTQLLQLLGVRAMTVHGAGAAVAAHGIDAPTR